MTARKRSCTPIGPESQARHGDRRPDAQAMCASVTFRYARGVAFEPSVDKWPLAVEQDRHIAFVGFMGAGKSSIGELTARRLGRAWYDTDQVIVARSGRAVVDFFAGGDEGAFRALEKRVIAELLALEPAVLSLGGGAVDDEDTRAILLERAFVIHLAISWRDLEATLPELRLTRPLLQGRTDAEIHELFLRRQSTYRQAHLRVQVPRGNLEAATDQLLTALSK